MTAPGEASPWILRFAGSIAPDSVVLDVAAGRGRHTRVLRRRGHRVVAIDVDTSGFDDLRDDGQIEVVQADLESGPWPLPGRTFDAVVITNYLHRPLFPVLLDSLAPGGVLLYETFARGHERFGRPTNPDFLLRPGELLDVVRGRLTVVAFEDVVLSRPARVQRIAAVRGLPRDWPVSEPRDRRGATPPLG